jgi:hypothetical protein
VLLDAQQLPIGQIELQHALRWAHLATLSLNEHITLPNAVEMNSVVPRHFAYSCFMTGCLTLTQSYEKLDCIRLSVEVHSAGEHLCAAPIGVHDPPTIDATRLRDDRPINEPQRHLSRTGFIE